MKSLGDIIINVVRGSLPVWEEWIEMRWSLSTNSADSSLPVWEEWIEIGDPSYNGASASVSSRMGRVD